MLHFWYIWLQSFISFCLSWNIGTKPVPRPLSHSQIGYNSLTSEIYIFGGSTTGSDYNIDNINIYKRNINSNSNHWFTLNVSTPSKTFQSQIKSSVTIQNIIYFIGVQNNSRVNQVHLFNLTSQTFINHTIPPYHYTASCGCLSTNSTHIFMIGGINYEPYYNDSSLIKYIQILDIAHQIWSYQLIDLEFIDYGWSGQYCSLVNDIIYVFGGQIGVGKYIKGMYKYNVLTSQWSFMGNISDEIGHYGPADGWAVYSPKYNRIYIEFQQFIYVFDVKTEKIIYNQKLLISVVAAPVFISNDMLMIFGGMVSYDESRSQFNQLSELPLMPTSSDNNKSISIGWVVAIVIIINSTICVVIGCIGVRRSRGRYPIEMMLNSYGSNQSVNSISNSTDQPPVRIM